MTFWVRGLLVVFLMKLGSWHGSMRTQKMTSEICKQVLWVKVGVCIDDLHYWLLWSKQIILFFQGFFNTKFEVLVCELNIVLTLLFAFQG